MALYFGMTPVKLNLNREIYRIRLFSAGGPMTEGARLISSDEYVITDKNRLYLTTKKEVSNNE